MLREGHEEEEGNARYQGFCVELLENIAAIVGFSYKITLVPDGKYGRIGEDGKWNGMVRELIERVSARRACLCATNLCIIPCFFVTGCAVRHDER